MDIDQEMSDARFREHVPLWRLLTDEGSQWGGPFLPSTLVEAIEIEGITGYDSTGRWKEWKFGSRQADEAITALEWFFENARTWPASNNADDSSSERKYWLDSIESQLADSSPLWRYGWPSKDLPELEQIEKEIHVIYPERSFRKRAANDQKLIGLLLSMLLGRGGCAMHPAFRDQAAIVKQLLLMASNLEIDGVGDGTLARKLKTALAAVNLDS